jgi:hypothetical protein
LANTVSVISPSSSLSRFAQTFTLNAGATVGQVRGAFLVLFSSGAAIDITLRIGLPQLQMGSDATPAILTSGSAVYLPRSNAYQDYNPSTLAPLGFLIEEQRTNLALWNRDATNAAWTKTSATATLTSTGLTGVANSASVLSATAADGLVHQSIVVSASTTYTFSVWLKAASATTLTIFIFDPVFATLGSTVCNVTTSWQRFTVTAGTGVNTGIKISIGGGSTFSTGEAVIMDCAQLEVGGFATSAIITTTAAATRLADSASITGTNFSGWYNQTEGTFVTEFSSQNGPVGTPSALVVNDNTFDNACVVRLNGGTSQSVVLAGTVVQASLFSSSIAAGVIAKMAAAYKANDFAFVVNAGTVQTDTSGAMPVVDRIFIGGTSGGYLNGRIRRLSYYRTRLPNATIQSVTT